MLPKFKGTMYDNTMETKEGALAVQEAISFLNI